MVKGISGAVGQFTSPHSFATVASFPPLHYRAPQQKPLKEWLDSLFRSIFTWIQAVIDVVGGMAPREVFG
jgi:hypothetical protein